MKSIVDELLARLDVKPEEVAALEAEGEVMVEGV